MLLLKCPGLAAPLVIDSIVWLQGDINYVWIHYVHGEHPQKYLSANTLKWAHAQLTDFIRIHQSMLINPSYIRQASQTSSRRMAIQLTNGLSLPVARRRIAAVRQQLGQRTGDRLNPVSRQPSAGTRLVRR